MASPLLSDFGRWHRVASENIIKAARDNDTQPLRAVVESAGRALESADNPMEQVLALGVIRTAVDMHVVSICSGQEPRPAS